MFENVKEKASSLVLKAKKSHVALSIGAVATSLALGSPEEAKAVGVSLLDTEVTTIISQFGDDLKVTVVALIAIIVPIGLALWGIGFAVKKGINYLQKRAKQAV